MFVLQEGTAVSFLYLDGVAAGVASPSPDLYRRHGTFILPTSAALSAASQLGNFWQCDHGPVPHVSSCYPLCLLHTSHASALVFPLPASLAPAQVGHPTSSFLSHLRVVLILLQHLCDPS